MLSTLPYDTTVVIDLTGGDDEILARMKPRGRRDVRKALRECPAQMADETARAAEDFSEYYQVMCETGSRDGFAPAPCADYQNMVRILGAEHCRVLAARVDGKVVAWSLLTISGALATRYYAATAIGSGRLRVADALLFFECQKAAEVALGDPEGPVAHGGGRCPARPSRSPRCGGRSCSHGPGVLSLERCLGHGHLCW